MKNRMKRLLFLLGYSPNRRSRPVPIKVPPLPMAAEAVRWMVWHRTHGGRRVLA